MEGGTSVPLSPYPEDRMIRYLPRYTFSIDIAGVPMHFAADYFDRQDGLPGYRELPGGLTKVQKAVFRTIEIPDVEPVVEQATAAPGEKRNVKVR